MRNEHILKVFLRKGRLCCFSLLMVLLLDNYMPAQAATIVINEIFGDPAAGLAGDANGDGVRHSYNDEFVEIVNNSDGAIDISGWSLLDATTMRHLFPSGTALAPHTAIVIFGGGTPTGSFGGALVQTASTGSLLLNNDGDSVILNDGALTQAVVTFGVEIGADQSLTLEPDISGSAFVKHSLAAGSEGALFSPGTMVDGDPFATPVPIPGAVLLLGSGLAVLFGARKKARKQNCKTDR